MWEAGVRSWEESLDTGAAFLSGRRGETIRKYVAESAEELANGNTRYFARHLPSEEHWRLFPEFRDSIAYLDIETTGLGRPGDIITTAVIYDGHSVSCYVNGDSLQQFKSDIGKYRLLVTFNGKCFDIPFIERYFRIRVRTPHIDLRYLLRGLGYRGGLKRCEHLLGLDRDELEGVDGYFAVLLWNDFKRSGDVRALETLLAYNIKDTVNLEMLMVMAYNMKLRETPFTGTHQLPLPAAPVFPFHPHLPTIDRIRRQAYRW